MHEELIRHCQNHMESIQMLAELPEDIKNRTRKLLNITAKIHFKKGYQNTL